MVIEKRIRFTSQLVDDELEARDLKHGMLFATATTRMAATAS
jgi:hypothetical protein